jgi:hypothetical protein
MNSIFPPDICGCGESPDCTGLSIESFIGQQIVRAGFAITPMGLQDLLSVGDHRKLIRILSNQEPAVVQGDPYAKYSAYIHIRSH